MRALIREQEVSLTTALLDHIDGLMRNYWARGIQRGTNDCFSCDRSGIEVAAISPSEASSQGGDFYGGRVLHALGIDRSHGVLRLSLSPTTQWTGLSRSRARLQVSWASDLSE